MIPNRWYYLYKIGGGKLVETHDKENLLDELELGKHGDMDWLFLVITDGNRVVKNCESVSYWFREERAVEKSAGKSE